MPEDNNIIRLHDDDAPPADSGFSCPQCRYPSTWWTTWERNEHECPRCGWTGLFATCTDISQ